MMNRCDWVSKLPKNDWFLEYPNLECLHLFIQVGSTYLNDDFWLLLAFLSWESKYTSAMKPFWSNGNAEKKISLVSRSLPPWLLCAIWTAKIHFIKEAPCIPSLTGFAPACINGKYQIHLWYFIVLFNSHCNWKPFCWKYTISKSTFKMLR